MKVYIGNDGCIEGQLSSTYVERFLKNHQLLITSDPSDADLVLFYACGLTKERENQSIALIINIKKVMKSKARLVVWGCLPRINPESLRKVYDGPLIGPTDTEFFKGIVEGSAKFDSMEISSAATNLVPSATPGFQYGDAVTDFLLLFEQNWNRLLEKARKNTPFFIRVAKGCTGTCTYCSERNAFGRIRSRDILNIISDFGVGLKQGYRLFSLMATDLGDYGRDKGCSLADLLEKITATYHKESYKIVLNQVNPSQFAALYSDLEGIFASGRIYSLSSPVQSGSNRLLRLMKRPYTVEEWKKHMLIIGNRFPRIRLVTQFMVGFPTETEEDVLATEKLLDYPNWFDYVHIFKFSSRPYVYASRMQGQVPESVKELRRRRLLKKFALTKCLKIAVNCTRGIF
jgi:MiaB/RimO family radical SAM methylthiotransferase